MLDNVNVGKAILAGLVGTLAMTALMLAAPLMGLPPMNIGKLLGSVLGGITALGWAMHFVIGTVMALIYAAFFATRLPGPAAVRGLLYGRFPWAVAQLMVMPVMGMGFFSGSAVAAGASLVAHLLYGAVVGGLYHAPEAATVRRPAHSHG